MSLWLALRLVPRYDLSLLNMGRGDRGAWEQASGRPASFLGPASGPPRPPAAATATANAAAIEEPEIVRVRLCGPRVKLYWPRRPLKTNDGVHCERAADLK